MAAVKIEAGPLTTPAKEHDMRDSEILQAEADRFKETMERVGLEWGADSIPQPPLEQYEQLPAEHKEFCVQRAADKWDEYHQALVNSGEPEFADTYFPVGENGGPGVSRLRQIGNYLQEKKHTQEFASTSWWDRAKSKVRNIFDLESESPER